tara:strand:+ start:1455 stop:1712 length:258 start_codon:yes stop_codon:yes gene_type:complete
MKVKLEAKLHNVDDPKACLRVIRAALGEVVLTGRSTTKDKPMTWVYFGTLNTSGEDIGCVELTLGSSESSAQAEKFWTDIENEEL